MMKDTKLPEEHSGFTMLGEERIKEKKLEDEEDWLMLKRSNSTDQDVGREDTTDTPTKQECKNEVTMIADGGSSFETWMKIIDSYSTNTTWKIKDVCSNKEVSSNLANLYYFAKKNIVFLVVFFLSGTYIHEILFSDEIYFPTTALHSDLQVTVPKQNRIEARDLLPAGPTPQQVLIQRLQQRIEQLESLQSQYAEELSLLAREKNHWQRLAVACGQEKREINQAFNELEESVKESKRLVPLGYSDYSLARNLSDVPDEPSALSVGNMYSALIVAGSTALTTVANRVFVDNNGEPSIHNSSRFEPIPPPSSISDYGIPRIREAKNKDGSVADYPNSSELVLAASTALVDTPSNRLKDDVVALPIGTSTEPILIPTCRECPAPLHPPKASTVRPWQRPAPHPAKVLLA